MARRKVLSENIRNIQQSKGSYLVSIPVGIIREFGWKQRQKVLIKKSGKKIIIEDWNK